jgi:hypothetical protein
MTAVEDRVRRALVDLAPTVPADGAARVGVARAVGRRRRRGVAGRVVATAIVGGALAVVAIAGPPAIRRDRAVVPATAAPPLTVTPPTTAPPPTAATVPPAETDAPADTVVPATTVPSAAAGASTAGDRVTFAGVSFVLPPGWVMAERRGDETICVEPAPDPYPNWDCSGLRMNHGQRLPGFETVDYVDHGPWAWYHATDVRPCPTGTDAEDAVSPPDGIGYDPIDTGYAEVGDHTAVYDQWAAVCRLSGFAFTPRAWHLPRSQIVIFEYFGRPETNDILASYTFP